MKRKTIIKMRLATFASVLFLMAVTTTATAGNPPHPVMSLAGQWSFGLDPENTGIDAEWFSRALPDRLSLPGCLQEQGFGNDPGPDTQWWSGGLDESPYVEDGGGDGVFRITSFLQPMKHYIGAAWYSREVDIPAAWEGRRITLFLERCHWETRLWVNDQEVGRRDGLGVPHEYDLSDVLSPGKHRLTLRVDNGQIVNVGAKAHSVSDQTAGTWNGVVGRIELRAGSPVWLEDVQVHPRVATRSIEVRGTVGSLPPGAGRGVVDLTVELANAGGADNGSSGPANRIKREIEVRWDDHRGVWESELALGPEAELWDEFNPVLHRLVVGLNTPSGRDEREVAFGLREIEVHGTGFLINGRPTLIRGNVDCAVFPQTGYAPMDVESWRHIWAIYKEWGFNLARFHSWCPPEAAFVAANEAGIYLAPEVSEWTRVATPAQEDFFRRESRAMLQRYGNHPSFVMMALGNEGGGDRGLFRRLLTEWKRDNRRLYSIKANSHANPPGVDYEVLRHRAGQRIRYQSGWPPEPLNTLFHRLAPQTSIDWREAVEAPSIPAIAHETGQFCAYPDVLNEPPRFTGYLKPAYLDLAREQLEERGMLDQVPDFVRASGLWQVELYKEEFEAHLRTPGLGGYHMLQLNDFSGQGTAPVGMLDATWTPKPYADSRFFRQFNAPTVLLARMDKRVWLSNETFAAQIEVTHYGATQLDAPGFTATVQSEDGSVLQTTRLTAQTVGFGSAQPVGKVEMPLGDVPAPARLELIVTLDGTDVRNTWNLWVFQESIELEEPGEVFITRTFDAEARGRLAEGGKVFLLPNGEDLAAELPMCFTTFYWTTFRLHGGQSSAAGLLCDPSHPVFDGFPTAAHTDWHWWELLTRASPMVLDEPNRAHPWPKSHRPIIQMIDGWKTNRKLAVLNEARVGPGRLAICSMDIVNDLDTRPVAATLRNNLLRYLKSDAWQPIDEIEPETVGELFKTSNP